jgi:diguanylate cyclase (GGDEF)-like protein
VRHLNAELQKENNDAELRLRAEERAAAALIALIGVLAIALLALSVRHRQSRRLNARLRQQAAELEIRRAEVETRRIELAAAHERLKAQSAQLYQSSITDPLTGLRNRGYGLNALRELLASSKSLGLRPVVMMLDIDHFKQINDRYGHAVGDRALERVAETLLIHAPPDAIVARHGGEEFLFVLRDADTSSGNFQAELIRRRFLELQVEHDNGVLHISVSIGVCHCAELEQVSVQAALRAADAALYRAKNAGRNCVRSA